ncbi:MAG: radical SAM protein [Acidobacteria bacterium]|jgi:DNA repair photolyase|nr:radical SAM protein [Bryobacteraceae bacterium CoA2 C42]
MLYRIGEQTSRTILTRTSGFLREAGFTHSLTPARNCTFGCSYCYVPTLRVQGGLRPEDWRSWGAGTTFKSNAAELLRRELRPEQVIYCSPLTDPYQPAEAERELMPEILAAVAARPPAMFVVQTRGPLIRRDIEWLRAIPRLRISFSVTTDNEAVRRQFEPHCAPVEERWRVIGALRAAGLRVHATLAPLLPCNAERLAERALAATVEDLIGDALHDRATKPRGATTRAPGVRLRELYPAFDAAAALATIEQAAARAGRRFGTGPAAFGWLTTPL